MTLSTSFSSKKGMALLLAMLVLGGCAGQGRLGDASLPAPEVACVAILPLDNLSGSSVPLKLLRDELTERVRAAGLAVLPAEELDAFLARHRVRYVGGVTRDDMTALRDETGVQAALITSVELYQESSSPRIALTARMVTTGPAPRIIGMETAALAGDDAPGLLGLGLIDSPQVLRSRAIDRLVAGLLAPGDTSPAGPSLTPATVFHNQGLVPDKRYSVAVLPFFNRSRRRNAGEILALHFIRELTRDPRFSVIEPGVVRQDLLQYRVIMEEGVSMADAALIFGVMRVDLLFTGNVNGYEDTQGAAGAPLVDFTALMLNRDNKKAGWAVDAHATGDDRVHLFDFGRLTTANALATAMTRGALKTLTTTGLSP